MKKLPFLLALAVCALPNLAQAGLVDVFVGYADNLRANPFFPIPFLGDPGTLSNTPAGLSLDNGVIRIDNNTGAALTISNFSYMINGSGAIGGVANLTIPNGVKGIFVLGDTSDIKPISPVGTVVTNCAVTCPSVSFSENGGAVKTFLDTAHVLDTGGFDLALLNSSNESFQWRLIGTTGGQSGVPELSTWAMMLVGFSLVGLRLRSRKALASAA